MLRKSYILQLRINQLQNEYAVSGNKMMPNSGDYCLLHIVVKFWLILIEHLIQSYKMLVDVR